MDRVPVRHPGVYLRDDVLAPRGLTVTAAAKLLGVGRPALSNFVNGHVTTSPAMARRIEVAFNVPSADLMRMQASYDASATAALVAPTDARSYVPPFLQVPAREIEAWVKRNIASRRRLAVFLRTLVMSTTSEIVRLDFPGNDDAERAGWDGFVETAHASPWVPSGKSGWEFGTNDDPTTKANHDLEKRRHESSRGERLDTTFVFVTPRHWPGKQSWASTQNATADWKEIRAYDSSDLEQWLEQSIGGQVWFADETNRAPGSGARSLDRVWREWTDVCQPSLSEMLFAQAVFTVAPEIEKCLTGSSCRPVTIGADSPEESLALLARVFSADGSPVLQALREKVIVFDTPGVLSRLAQGTASFIAVTANRDVERELAQCGSAVRSILLYPLNVAEVDLTVRLGPVSSATLEKGLQAMGLSRDEISRLETESGRSLTVLRRRLCIVPALKTPPWAAQHQLARSLIPFMFAGAWNSQNSADQSVVSELAGGTPYERLEVEVQRLAAMGDAPVWSLSGARGVISRIDALFGVSNFVTADDLDRFYEVARALVLNEDDPALDLPSSQRWAAALFGKTREITRALRDGIAEGLVMLSVHGDRFFKGRIGYDCSARGGRLVRELLKPLTARKLEANSSELRAYAETAPAAFLDILEEDLEGSAPALTALLRPADTGPFGNCPRSGLLWALEVLAWNPQTMPRSVLVLGRLAQVEITDNWANTPLASLRMIFEARMPQTAASEEERTAALQLLAAKHPSTAWKLCVELISSDRTVLHYSAKPRWRPDAIGFGEPLPAVAVNAFLEHVVELMLGWADSYPPSMLADLVRCVARVPARHQARIWEVVRTWAHSDASEREKADLREDIRRNLLGRRALRHRSTATGSLMIASAKEIFDELEPADLIARHEWLFRDTWLDASLEELGDDAADYGSRERRVEAMRVAALREVLALHGTRGLIDMAGRGNAAHLVGALATQQLIVAKERPQFALEVLQDERVAVTVRDSLAAGVVRAVDSEVAREAFFEECRQKFPVQEYSRLLRIAPFDGATWRFADALRTEERLAYWRSVNPDWMRRKPRDLQYAAEQLLGAQRPRAAFASLRYQIDECDPELLLRVLEEAAKGGVEAPGQFQLDQHDVEEAFQRINSSPAFSIEQRAALEFVYFDALTDTLGPRGSYGIPNLERHLETHPELFVQAVTWAFGRDDEGEDSTEGQQAATDRKGLAERGYRLIHALRRIPGQDEHGLIDAEALKSWLSAVRERCRAIGRLEVGDVCLGELLSVAATGGDSVWPCEVVRDVVDEIRSSDVVTGMMTGRLNARGAVWRGEGGDQERRLADVYRRWEKALQFTHPFVASELLGEIARSYEREAEREDASALVRRRLM
ncbi:MAG: helix-turn-helix transcriptional regulator [Gemmatimonadaceae bacterium]